MELPKDTNAIDYNSISDVVLKISYTAREGGDPLKAAARAALAARRAADATNGGLTPALQRMFSARDDLALAWNRFLHPGAGDPLTLGIPLTKDHFSYLFREKDIQVTQVDVYLITANGITHSPSGMSVEGPNGAATGLDLGTWVITRPATLPSDVVDLLVVFTYTVS